MTKTALKPAILAGAMAHAYPRAIVAQRIRADASDPKAMIAQLQAAFTEFRAANDEKLNGKADAVLDEKVQRIDTAVGNFQAAIDELNAKMALRNESETKTDKFHDGEYNEAWSKFFKDGFGEEDIKSKQKTGPRAAMTVGSNPDGGYLAPVEWDRTITNKLKLISPIRQNAQVQSISGAGIRKVYNDRALVSGWVGEIAARPATAGSQLGVLDFLPGELFAFPFASQTLLEDPEVDVEAWLASECEPEFARQEGIAFLSGDGVNKPRGLLTYVTGAANAAYHPWGAIQTVASGDANKLTSDSIIDLIYALPAGFTANAKLYMNRLTQSAARKFKDEGGNYIWQPSFESGQPATLLGESIVDVPDMPNVGAGNIAALYGDMAATYLVVDRVGIMVLRDPYTNKPFVGFYTRKRVGGGVQNPEPMRALKVAAS